MKIKKIFAREIFDSFGLPTIECEIMLSSGETATTAISHHGAHNSKNQTGLYDLERFDGAGVQNAVNLINKTFAPLLCDREPHLLDLDQLLQDTTQTRIKENLGSNTMRALSTAICKAQALSEGISVYETIGHMYDIQSVSIPLCMLTIFEGHNSHSSFPFKSISIIPHGTVTFKDAFEIGAKIFQAIGKRLTNKSSAKCIGINGGYAPHNTDIAELFKLLLEEIELLELTTQVVIGLEIGDALLYNNEKRIYQINDTIFTSEDIIGNYASMIEEFGLYTLEDGLGNQDWEGWNTMMETLGDSVQVIGNELFLSKYNRIIEGIENALMHGIAVVPADTATVTEILQASKLADMYETETMVTHAAQETVDDFIADFAVGTNATYLKAGGLLRSEFLAKYHRLIKIEEELIALADPEQEMDFQDF
ncbi:hypothetical protein IPH25_01515 [bacterium]|nr:MAG: hypothetical protein IPG37_03645 [bacterium]QQR62105.1 MAG: hypothetical protein IPH25_01515 [bacterium]